MSKGNPWFGTVTGKLGESVFARRLGEQTQRTYVRRVNDANTRAQVSQRSKLANIVSSYRAYRTLLQRAFESKNPGQTDYNVFASINLPISQVYLDQYASAAGACVIAPYGISRGVLPSVQVSEDTAGVFTSDIALGSALNIGPATTVAAFSTAVLGNNQDWIEGDQLTIVHAEQWLSAAGYPMASVRLYEVVLSTTDGALLYDSIPATAIENLNGFVAMQNPDFIGGVAIVHSRRETSGALKVSSQSIMLSMSDTIYSQYAGGVAQSNAVTTRGYDQGAYLDPNSSHQGAGGSIPNAMTIATFTVGGANVLARTAYSANQGVQVVITGQGLDSSAITLEMYDLLGPLPIEQYMTINSETPTRITATWTGGNGDWKQLVSLSKVVKTWDEDEVINPGT